VSRVAAVIAELRGVSVERITEATDANFARLFVP
jgi:Tat protein secretion system quality control protein TatD with DNase activity